MALLVAPEHNDVDRRVAAPSVPRRRPSIPLLGSLAVAFIVVVFLVDVVPRATSAFGDSVEAMNAGTWLVGSRSMVEDGVVESRLGAHSAELGTYAHHPPGVVFAAAIGRLVPGDVPFFLRLPAVAASVASILLLYRVLRASGFGTAPAVAGVAAAAGSPMFLIFGSMMNMEAISLPFILWLLLCRQQRFSRRVPTMLAAFSAAVTSWQGLAVVSMVGFVALVGNLRRRRLFDPAVLALAAGLVAAAAVTVGWLWWANGGLAAVTDAAEKRQAVDSLTVDVLLRRQWHWLDLTFPSWTLAVAVPGALAALIDRRTRSMLLVTAFVVVAFVAGFLEGSYEHVFWNWWIVIPFGLCAAAWADVVAQIVDRGRERGVGRAAILVASLVSVVVVATWTTPEERRFWSGVPAGQLLASTDLPASQSTTYFFYGDEWATWASWYTHRAVKTVWTSTELREIARYEPDSLVLVRRRWPFDESRTWERVESRAAATRGGSYALVTVDELAGLVAEVGL